MIVADVVSLFDRWGWKNYDDDVSQLDHGLQCAALASNAGAPDALVAAALLHDLGHLLELDESSGGIGNLAIDRRHEAHAPRLLAASFPAAVTAPIALHVDAKRYLCAIEPSYLTTLSAGSVRSLDTQGGPMAAEEVARFAALPAAADAVALRRWDDLGKVEHLVVAPLVTYLALLDALTVP